MSSLCRRSISSRVISQLHVDRLLTSKPKEPSHRCRSVGPVAPDRPRIDQPRRPGPWRGRAPCLATTIHPVRFCTRDECRLRQRTWRRKQQCSRSENSCFPPRFFSAPLLRSRRAPPSRTHLEALTSNVTAAHRRPSDAYRMDGSCEAGSPATQWPRPPWLVDTRMVRGHWPD